MVETAAPVVVAGRTIGWARVAMDHRPQGAAMRATIAEGLAYIALAIVLGTLFALWIAGRLTAELSHLSDETNRLRDGERSFDRVAEPCREVARLEQAFLDMAETIWTREDQLRHTIDQLATSNEDLERFAYVASHDLQTPLRNVGSYAQLLARRYRGRIDADADEFIDFIVGGTKHMSAMIHDLLDYARLSSRGTPLEPVPAGRALETALANLSGLVAETGAVVSAQDLPVVMADESQLVSLLQNLIENAVKYRHPDRRPEIAVTAEALPSHQWRFAVADNGIGIEPEYFDRIFAIFQRLRPETGAEGTGIGLAVCQRIAHRFGGRIWVESVPGRGTTLFFTLIDGRAPPAISAPSPATGL
ncbi:MAG: hypothetical protein HY985_09580 [Magnetospirillum sp.]|nr:hypothetical protein [Magnetospirillum sp.]